MPKALRLGENDYLVMDHIVEWWFSDNDITIVTTSADERPRRIISDTMEHPGCHSHKVTVNEFHRIKREINEYMGVVQ